jgi:predicted 3-demethylubiquinone-9 3-methyltransferase (glyoxalase superfamily)
MKKITPFLWFEKSAEEAARFYVSIFKDAEIIGITRPGIDHGREPAPALSTDFRLGNQEFIAFNGGPLAAFSPATSFLVECADQAEVDYYWERLSAGGEQQQCGWLKDKFGVTWQIVPAGLQELLYNADAGKAKRATEAMLKMKKLDIAAIRRAAERPEG